VEDDPSCTPRPRIPHRPSLAVQNGASFEHANPSTVDSPRYPLPARSRAAARGACAARQIVEAMATQAHEEGLASICLIAVNGSVQPGSDLALQFATCPVRARSTRAMTPPAVAWPGKSPASSDNTVSWATGLSGTPRIRQQRRLGPAVAHQRRSAFGADCR